MLALRRSFAAGCGCSTVGALSRTAVAPVVLQTRALCLPTTPLLRPRGDKFAMSKRRQMMKQKHYCRPGPSIPIFILVMGFATLNIFVTMWGKNDDSMYR